MLVKGSYLILGNWKMHLTMDAAVRLATEIVAVAGNLSKSSMDIGLAPAFVHIAAICEVLKGSSILLGAQTCHAQDEGAYTGEISAAMLKDARCDFVIIGHSERRHIYNESNEQVREKTATALRHGLHAVVCVGETLQQREEGIFLDVIETQLRQSLPDGCNRDSLTVSYEPVWAIGTGKTASAHDIDQAHEHIQAVLRDMLGSNKRQAIPRVLYGGSVKANNALDILALPVVDGVLVGGASLDANAFKAIIEAAEISARKR